MTITVDSQGSLLVSNPNNATAPKINLVRQTNVPSDQKHLYKSVSKTLHWEGSFNVNPEDRSLAVVQKLPDDLDATPDRFLEIWYRFQRLGWDWQLGDKCIFTSYLLRKIMILHGFKAHVQEVVSEFRHPTRQWAIITGGDHAVTDGLRTHSIVVSNGWILDYAQMPIHMTFGALAPKAVVARAKFDTWQDLGFFGQIRYIKKSVPNEETLNQRILQRQDVHDMVRKYFSIYRAR